MITGRLSMLFMVPFATTVRAMDSENAHESAAACCTRLVGATIAAVIAARARGRGEQGTYRMGALPGAGPSEIVLQAFRPFGLY